MAYSQKHEYNYFKSPAVREQPEQSYSSRDSIAAPSSTASQMRTVMSFLKDLDRVHDQQGAKTTNKTPLIPQCTFEDEQETRIKQAWLESFQKFLALKNDVICMGEMKYLAGLMTHIAHWIKEYMNKKKFKPSIINVDTIETIMNYNATQKHIIVIGMNDKTSLRYYSDTVSEILSYYLCLNVQIAKPLSSKIYRNRAVRWMTQFTVLCDFSLDRICDTILKTNGIAKGPPDILGETILGLVDLCVKHCCSNNEGTSKRMCVLTFIRTMLVYQRVIRWYRKVYEEEPERLASSKITCEGVVMHRVDFCMKHIIPPEHLKEVIQLLGEDVSNRILDDLPPYEQILASLPPHEQDKTTMNRMLTRNYSTGNAYEDLTAIACNKDILPLLALDSRQVTPQFPYLAVQEATVADALDPGATKFDSREEERLHAFSLKIMHERVKKHCLSDMTSVYTSSAENPQSVQSEDSESSQKISSTTVVDMLDTPYPGGGKMSPGDEELSSRTGSGSISMMKLPLDMTMAYITIVENGVKKGLTPCFVIDNAEDGSLRVGGIGRESHGKVPVKRVVSVRHNQSISDMSDMSADEESGTKPPSSSAASTPCKVNKPRGVVRQMETRAKKAASGKGPKRKVVERCGEVPPDKRPRQSSTGHEPHSQPPTTPLQSVIHHTDPSKAGPGSFDCLKSSSGEGEAEPLELMGSCFMDYDGPWESSYDMIMKSVSLTEVEGNQDLGGSNHHAAAAGGADQTPGSQQSIDSGNSLFPHDGDSRASFVGDPLLNNTQSELVKTHHPPNKATGPGIGVKRLDTAYYPDMETTLDPYQVMGDEDYLHRLGRRTTAVVKKANHQTTSINHLPCDPNQIRISPRTRSSHPVSRKATRRDPGGGGSEDTSSETSASTTPLKKPDKAREWLANEGSNNAISQLMSALYGSGGAGEGKMGAKLKDSVREKLHDLMTKAEQQGGAITKTREDSASLEGSEDHAPSDLPPSPLFPPHSSYPTVTSLSTNSLDKLSSVGPRPRKSPSHTPTGEVEVKRGPGRPRKKTRAPKSKLAEEVVLQRNSVDSIDEDPVAETKKPPGRRKREEVSPLTLPDRTAEGRLRNNQFLDSLSQKLSAEPYPSGDEPHSPRDDSVSPNAKNLDIIQSVCEKLTETMKPTKSKA